MADIKWSQFSNVGDVVPGDEIVGLRSGVNVRFNSPAILSDGSQIVYVSSVNGVDAVGNGGILNPYATLEYAMSQITTATSTTPFAISLETGDYSEVNLLLKPWVYIEGNNSNLTITNSFALDTWNISGGNVYISNINNLVLSNNATLDFDAANGTNAILLINGLIIRSSNSINITGSQSVDPTSVYINNFNSTSDLNINDCNVYLKNIIVDSFNHINTLSAGFNCYINNLTTTFLYYFENIGLNLYLTSSNLLSGTFKANGPDQFIINSEGNNFYSINFDAPSDLISLVGQTLTVLPILANGAVYTPTPIGNSINANYVPVNYSPSDVSVTGNFIGIDNALGSSNAQDLEDVYNTGDNALVQLVDDRPIAFQMGISSSGTNAISTPATGTNTVANYRISGWTFVPNIDLNITALQYDDSLFTQPGTRETGIWLKSTQELLGSVFISKTDPLIGGFRTTTLNSPIQVLAGIEYVFDTVVPANESNHLNADAVPSADIAITERAELPSSSFPISLQFPQSFVVSANDAPVGSFEYNTFTINESVSINDSSTDDSTLFEVSSTTRSSHPAPSMTSAQRLAISAPNIGDLVFDTDLNTYSFYNGSSWTLVPINFPIAPFSSLVNSIPFPNQSLGNPAKYYYSIDFVLNGIISLWDANNVRTVRLGYPVYFKNNSAFVATIKDSSASNTLATLNPGDFYMFQLDTGTTIDGTWIVTNLHSSLQEAYNKGQSISIAASDPMTISNSSSSIEYNNDSESYLSKVMSTTQGVIDAPIMTVAQRDAIVSPDEGLRIYNSDYNTIDHYDGSSWQTILNLDGVVGGTNITILNNGDGTITINSSGSGLLNGGYAIYAASSGGTTTFSNSSYKPIEITVATSSESNINVNNDGSIEIVSDGTYDFEYVISARSSIMQNDFALAIAVNGVAQTASLQSVYLPTAISSAGNSVVLKYTFPLVANDVVAPYIANIGTLANDFIAQQLIGSINQNLASSSTLQQAYDNGDGTIQGNLTTKPFEVKNSGGTALLTFTESAGSLTGNSSTATSLQTARTIGGVSFDGTANIVPQTIQSVDESSDTTCFPLFINSSGSQSLQPKNNAALLYNSSTNILSLAGMNLSGLTASSLVATDSSKNLTSTTSGISPTFAGLTLNGTYVNPGQPAFGARNSTTRTDVTGDGTAYTVIFDTEDFDQANNFDGTSTFTAPVTGKYQFNINLFFGELTASHTIYSIALVTTNATYVISYGNSANMRSANNNMIAGGSVLVNMSLGHTATVVISVSNGTKVVDVVGATNRNTYFSGFLVA